MIVSNFGANFGASLSILSEDNWVASGVRGHCLPLECLNHILVAQQLLSLYTPVASLSWKGWGLRCLKEELSLVWAHVRLH